MTEIEKIKQYIIANKPREVDPDSEMTTKEILALASGLPAIDATLWAFTYGRAKGYRAAKKEVQA